MKFAHLADIHLGCWKDDNLNELGMNTFKQVMKEIIKEKVDFIVISGDIFDSSYPKIDTLKEAMTVFKELKELDIPIYTIAGSHDYSPTDKTILKVFENGGFIKNVYNAHYADDDKIALDFTIDEKTGTKLTGILGRIKGTDYGVFKELDRKSLEATKGYKIFLFHNAITELKSDELKHYDSIPKSLLPQNFNYYAAGHIHIPLPNEITKGTYSKSSPIIYPGCLNPTSFDELETQQFGGYCIIEDSENDEISVEWKSLKLIEVVPLEVDAEGKNLEALNKELLQVCKSAVASNKIITLRIEGKLRSGSPSNIDYRELNQICMDKGAIKFIRNTRKFTSEETFVGRQPIGYTRSDIEQKIINENLGKVIVSKWDEKQEENVMKELLLKCSRGIDSEQKVKDFKAEQIEIFLDVLGIKSILDKYDGEN